MELRARTCTRCARACTASCMVYDQDHNQYCAPFKNDPGVVCPSYGALCASVTKPGEYADVMCILALSAVTGVPMQSYFPPLAVSFSIQPLTRCIVGGGVNGRGVICRGQGGQLPPPPKEKIICRAIRLTRVATSSQDVFYAIVMSKQFVCTLVLKY